MIARAEYFVNKCGAHGNQSEYRHKIAALFCKAYEKAVLLTPTPENVHYWVDCTRMRPEEIEDSIQDSYELAQVFQTIGDILKNEVLPTDQQVKEGSDDR